MPGHPVGVHRKLENYFVWKTLPFGVSSCRGNRRLKELENRNETRVENETARSFYITHKVVDTWRRQTVETDKHICGISKAKQDNGSEQTVQENVPEGRDNLKPCALGEMGTKWPPPRFIRC